MLSGLYKTKSITTPVHSLCTEIDKVVFHGVLVISDTAIYKYWS